VDCTFTNWCQRNLRPCDECVRQDHEESPSLPVQIGRGTSRLPLGAIRRGCHTKQQVWAFALQGAGDYNRNREQTRHIDTARESCASAVRGERVGQEPTGERSNGFGQASVQLGARRVGLARVLEETLGRRLNLVAAVRVMPDNTRQTTNRRSAWQHAERDR
jgi:hypothetical protein